MSYLDTPRLHFTGFFQADVSTINNDVRYYDNSAFQEEYQKLSLTGDDGGWNPEGTGIFRLMSCQVTGAQLGDQQITTAEQDPVIGMLIENADSRVSGKLVDLDPQQQMVSQIWGMQVRLTNGVEKALFIGDYEPAAFINLWQRQQEGVRMDQKLGAVYQSILRNVVWQGKAKSKLLDALQHASEKGGLAINMNVYGYGRDPAIPRYTLGRVSGTIGPWAPSEPKHFVMGRQMMANTPQSPTNPSQGVYSFQAKVHESAKTLTADFGNCFQIQNASGDFVDNGSIVLGLLKTDTPNVLVTVTADQVAIIGEVPYLQKDWYSQTAGVQDFDIGANQWVAQNINTLPLVLLSPQADGAYKVLVQESLGGVYVRADQYVFRLDPGEMAEADFYASKFGLPLAAGITTSVNEGAMGGSGAGDQPLTPPVQVPNIATPADAISYPATIETNASGKGMMKIQASLKGPGNPRGYIDGQLYGIGYQLTSQPAGYLSNFWNFISVLAFDATIVPAQPTWYADIQPILQQYGNLYPIMSKHLVRLGEYDSVVEHLKILTLAFSLPIENANHMPVTRDLSDAKRKMILKWLTTAGADGLPIKGQPAAVPLRAMPAQVASEPVPLNMEPLQTGGKTAVILQFEARQKAIKGKS
ncbi:MAG TPA: hypothetical protein VM532_05795 [Burkholderiales bacterium]|nr:hypothetical protein [Burkholderiales bacterium]